MWRTLRVSYRKFKKKVDVIQLRKPKIVVLGAGYGGLMTVTRLQKQLSKMKQKSF